MLFFFLHAAFAGSTLQSESIQIDDYIQNLEQNAISKGTWERLNADVSHTFPGRASMATRWIEEVELSPKVLQSMYNEMLYIYPNYM